MSSSLCVAACVGLVSAMPAMGQSAAASLTAPSMNVASGSSVSVSLVVDFTTGAAGAGVFGPSGLYGFGGSVETSGSAASNTSASNAATGASLTLGPIADTTSNGSRIARAAAGRTLADGGLSGSPQIVLTFDVDIDAGAMPGDTVTINFDGAVVLSLDDTLVTFSTDPGPNQMSLSTNALTLTIGGGRLCGDVNGDGSLTPADFTAWLGCFNNPLGQAFCDPNADVNQSGSTDPADFTAWLSAFNQGANGPACTP